MCEDEIPIDPHNYVVFECPFDYLMEEVGRNQLMDVGSWEVVCKWLMNHLCQ